MTAFWHARYMDAFRKVQTYDSQWSRISDRMTSLQNRVNMFNTNFDNAYQYKQRIASAAHSSYSQAISQKISELQADNADGKNNKMIQQLQAQLQQAKMDADMELQNQKWLMDEAKRAQTEPLTQMETELKVQLAEAENNKSIWTDRMNQYKKRDEESNKSFYGGSNS